MVIALASHAAFLLALCTIQNLITLVKKRHLTLGEISAGLAYGGISVVAMMTPIALAPGHILDARSVVLAAAGLLGGPLAGGIAAFVASLYRGYVGGGGATVGILAIIACVVLGLAYREILHRGWARMRFAELLVFGFVVHVTVAVLFNFLPEAILENARATTVPMIVSFTPATALLVWLLNFFEEHHKTRQSLEEANFRFHQIADNIREIFYITNPDRSEIIYVSPAFETVWGRSCESLRREPWLLFDAIHPDDLASVEATTDRHRLEEFGHSYRIIRADKSVRTVRSQAFPIRNQDGEVYRIAGVIEDITDLEERLVQLNQSQKMQSLGQLTGGVAHDFNNLLQIILGHCEILRQQSNMDSDTVDDIERAAQRGADLTGRLLSFARREPLKAEAVDVAALIDRVAGLLERTIRANIKIDMRIQADLWPAMVDASQLENALINLAVNARDAMSSAGTLIFVAANVAGHGVKKQQPNSGKWIRISVIDDGVGMPEAVRAQALDPFFTTKDVGHGTGLGLSIVYGFIKQSGGHIEIESREGVGTTILLYLPSAH